ncbi:MAG: DUF4450 domain-containing protein [Bacteroidales bacterium]|nr:DUF4450 domain-containing protein [Bacteroidales bacterium]
MKYKIYALFVFTIFSLNVGSQAYTVKENTITGHNIDRYNNRPLYINNSNAFILAGDKPIARFAKDNFMYGTFMLAVVRDDEAKWLQDCDNITFIYRPGMVAWKVTDASFPGLIVNLDVLPMAGTTGMTLRAGFQGALPGDKIVWTYGGSHYRPVRSLSWELDVLGHPDLINWGFIPEECTNTNITIDKNRFLISLTDTSSANRKFITIAGYSTATGSPETGQASLWKNIPSFISSEATDMPLVKGIFSPENGQDIYWAMEAFEGKEAGNASRASSPDKAFFEGVRRSEEYLERVKINTPDAHLNFMAQSAAAALDGLWYPPVYHHGAMQWNVRLPGWRTIFGGTMYGWHNRVKEQAGFYIGSQVKESDKTQAKSDPAMRLTQEHPDSRFYGKGRILTDQAFYNMQSQFFDQLIEEWRWTTDPEFEKMLREALNLHLEWLRDCFDPDGDGLYESYLNVWPTDSQWYNGGGTAEETSYAWRAHEAARDMARRAGDTRDEEFHNAMLEKIKKSFFAKLWMKDMGFSASYIEQGGHERLHTNPWLYSIFLPVDAKLTSPVQSLESVYYSEWALQNDRMPLGGRRVWTSNWVPGIWSVRELWPGDNYHLALSYFQSGLPNDAWDIMRGTFMHDGFGSTVPGNLGGPQGGIDFGDCVHMFARTLVQGLFGYNPDYPNNTVRVSPQFPTEWNEASIEIPDVKIRFNRQSNNTEFSVELTNIADLDIRIPVQARKVKSVKVNGKKVKWELVPSAGNTMVKVVLPKAQKADIVVETEHALPYYSPEILEGNARDAIELKAKDAVIVEYYDPQKVLAKPELKNGIVTSELTANKGHHTVVARVIAGECPQLRVFRIKINNPAEEQEFKAKFVDIVPADAAWEEINISQNLNADLREIFKQKYLSPRPNTVSARIGDDGYSPWTFPHWKLFTPEIDFGYVNDYLDGNRIITPQEVPFLWNNGQMNVAFTSLWDNYPHQLTFPVNRKGKAAWLLVSGSTNVMQCQIANAVIRLNYADGKTDSLELIPPVNYWNLSPIITHAPEPGQNSRNDYLSEVDTFCLPGKLPEFVQLGKNCRAMVLNIKMRDDAELKSITLETLSQEVVVGLMGITLME